MPYILQYNDSCNSPYLEHFQAKGAKWGERRWQNYDGSLTPAGRIHYGYGPPRESSSSSGKVMSYRDNKKLAKQLTRAIKRDIRERSWHDVSGDPERYKNQREVNTKINEQLKDTEEAKAANKAWDEREKYWDEHRGEYVMNDKKLDELDKNVNDTQDAYHEKAKVIHEAFRDEMLSAKLKDLRQEDTAEARKVLNAILKDDDVITAYTGLKNSREAGIALKELSKSSFDSETNREIQKRSSVDFDGDNAMKDAFTKMRNNSKTDEEKDQKVSRWERARDKDLWDLDFMEAVQNSAALYDGDTNTLLREYAKYLDDPRDYMENGARKLKNV